MGGSLNLPEHKKALFHSELQMTLGQSALSRGLDWMTFRGFQPQLFCYHTDLTYSGVPNGKCTSRSTFPDNLWIWVLQG